MTQPPQLELAFQTLLSGFGRLDLLSSAIRSAAQREHEFLRKNEIGLREINREDLVVSTHNMTYRDIRTNAPIFYDFKERGVKELTEDLISYRNKQYQWVLVDAFEFFEHFVKACCLECVRLNPGGETANANDGLAARLNVLRAYLPSFCTLEVSNARQLNYRSAIALIEMLRHVVVHNGGWIRDETKFFKKLGSLVQKNNGGKHDSDIENHAKFFLFRGRHGIEVYLLEEADKKRSPMHTDRLGTLLGWLLTYASSLNDHLVRATK
jgi:hypothetical protein